MKVVINTRYGGYGLSTEAIKLYAKKANKPIFGYVEDYEAERKSSEHRPILRQRDNEEAWLVFWLAEDIGDSPTHEQLNAAKWFEGPGERHDPILVEVVEELGERADGDYASLKVVEIPDDVDYVIEEYDGTEWISEIHRTWG